MGRHICHITTVHPARDIRIFYKECSALAQEGFKVTLLVANSESFRENGVEVIGVPVTYSNRIQRILRTPGVLFRKALEVDAEVYHFHDPEFIPSGLKLIRKGKKVIYDVHEDVPRQILAKFWIPAIFRSLVANLFERYENYSARRMSHLVTSTPTIRNRFKKLNPATTDINNYPIINELMRPIEWDKKKNQVCYVGGISVERGITNVLEALEELDGVEFNLAGNFSPESYREEVLQSKAREKILFWGFVDRKGTSAILGRSRVGLVTLLPMPNHIDSQPNKMFEYMAAGLPVVSSGFPLWRSIVEGHECGICVDPSNPKEIREAIQTILDNPGMAQKMGENGQAAVREKYNWQQEKNKLVDLYNHLLDPEPIDAT